MELKVNKEKVCQQEVEKGVARHEQVQQIWIPLRWFDERVDQVQSYYEQNRHFQAAIEESTSDPCWITVRAASVGYQSKLGTESRGEGKTEDYRGMRYRTK